MIDQATAHTAAAENAAAMAWNARSCFGACVCRL